jgi:hypothetical protein
MLDKYFLKQGSTQDEFDDSREVVQSLVQEYIACESPNYIQWGASGEDGSGGQWADTRMR